MDNNILTILTESDREEIKKALKDIIIDQIRSDFADCNMYLFDQTQLSEMMDEAIEEVKLEIRPLLEKKLLVEMREKLNM